MSPIPTFQTRRLILTPLELTDAPAIQQLFPHWEVVRYLDSRVPWPYPDDGALAYVRDHALPRYGSRTRVALDDPYCRRVDTEHRQHQPLRPTRQQPRVLAGSAMAGKGLHARGL